MPSVATIINKISNNTRKVFDAILDHRLTTNLWPTDRWIYKQFTSQKFGEILKPLNGAFIVEMDSSGTKTYELQPIGVLCTSSGDRYMGLLRRFVEYLRRVYFENDRQNNITHAELIEHAKFTSADSTELGRLFDVAHFFGCHPGHAPDFSTWSVQHPNDLSGILPDTGPTEKAFEALLLRHWHPHWPISYDERSRKLFAGSALVLEQAFGVSSEGPPASRSKEARKRTHIPSSTETQILTDSRRRCAFCFGLSGHLEEAEGQIAHIDHDRQNANPSNLVFLCSKHHNAYDSSMRLVKGYTARELRHYRAELWKAIKRGEHVRSGLLPKPPRKLGKKRNKNQPAKT